MHLPTDKPHWTVPIARWAVWETHVLPDGLPSSPDVAFVEPMLRTMDADIAQALPEAHARWAAERPFALEEPFARVPINDAVARAAAAT